MPIGFEAAFGEITLVLFTTLAPSGIFASMLLCAPLLSSLMDGSRRCKLAKFLCVPLAITIVGLVASATHLGNPSNALYVLLGVGRSPLSNEVFSVGAYLGFAALFWLYSFAEAPRLAVQRCLIAGVEASGVLAITMISLAYGTETILTWNSAYVPAALWLNAVAGGSLLALATARAAGCGDGSRLFGRPLVAACAVATTLCLVVYVLQAVQLAGLANAMVAGAALAPAYGFMIAAFAALCAAGVCVAFSGMRSGRRLSVSRVALATALVFAGLFVMRFGFYTIHMTVGLG